MAEQIPASAIDESFVGRSVIELSHAGEWPRERGVSEPVDGAITEVRRDGETVVIRVGGQLAEVVELSGEPWSADKPHLVTRSGKAPSDGLGRVRRETYVGGVEVGIGPAGWILVTS